jgi:hypothetical protein
MKLAVNRLRWAMPLRGWTILSLMRPSPTTWMTIVTTISGRLHIQLKNHAVTGLASIGGTCGVRSALWQSRPGDAGLAFARNLR